MLRGKSSPLSDAPSSGIDPRTDTPAYPSIEEPYGLEERPVGIRFYRAKDAFFLPYHLLQRVCCEQNKLILSFPGEDIVVSGQGLHELFVNIAAHRVCHVIEQGERYRTTSEGPLFISTIERVPMA